MKKWIFIFSKNQKRVIYNFFLKYEIFFFLIIFSPYDNIKND